MNYLEKFKIDNEINNNNNFIIKELNLKAYFVQDRLIIFGGTVGMPNYSEKETILKLLTGDFTVENIVPKAFLTKEERNFINSFKDVDYFYFDGMFGCMDIALNICFKDENKRKLFFYLENLNLQFDNLQTNEKYYLKDCEVIN